MDVLLRNGDALERVHIDGDTAVIGRAAHCDVVVNENYVSKQHLRIFQGVVVVDLGSANGSFIGEDALTSPILLGDREVRLGKGDLTIQVEGSVVGGLATIQQGDAGAEPVADGELEQLREQNRRLQAQLKKLDQEVRALRQDNARLQSEAAAPAVPEVQPEPAPAPVAPPKASEAPEVPEASDSSATPEGRPELDAARLAILEMQKRLSKMKPGGSSSQPSAPAPTARPAAAAPTPPAATPPTSVPATGPGIDDTADLIARLARDDALGVQLPPGSSLHDFLVVEAFRFLRRIEKVVTRTAGELIQLYQMNTILPDVEANLRTSLRELAAQPADPGARDQLTDYMQELGRWLIVSLGAYRRAAARFADGLCTDLSEEALTRDQAIPTFKKKEAELWRRVCQYLSELTPDFREERIEKYAREAAGEMVDSGGAADL